MAVTRQHKWLQLPDQTLGIYNAWDTYCTARLYTSIRQELSDNGQLQFLEEEYWPLVPAVMAMAKRGLQVDVQRRAKLKEELSAELGQTDQVVLGHFGQTFNTSRFDDALAEHTARLALGAQPRRRFLFTQAERARLRALLGLNPDSPQQLAQWLFGDLGLKPGKSTPTGQPSTDIEALAQVLGKLRKKDEPHRPSLYALFHRSRLRTVLERYLDFPVDPDGRVRPSVKMYRAETGRLAYAEPPLQQWPPEARDVFQAADGYLYLACDYSQLEARILAYLADDTPSLQVFMDGGDVHRQNAMDLFGYSEADWAGLEPRARVALRNFAKGFLYGISYGGAAETMKTKLFCPCPRCEDKVPPTVKLTRAQIRTSSDRWFALHPAVPRWRTQLVRAIVGPGGSHSYTTPLGRKRYFFAPWPTVEREIYNYPMQATAAGIVDRATIGCHAIGAPLVLQMHDELVFEVPEGEVQPWAARIREVMERPVEEMGGTVFPIEQKAGPSWGQLEPLAA